MKRVVEESDIVMMNVGYWDTAAPWETYIGAMGCLHNNLRGTVRFYTP
jgi:hypothetical protein